MVRVLVRGVLSKMGITSGHGQPLGMDNHDAGRHKKGKKET